MNVRYLTCLYLLAIVWLLSSIASPAKADVVSEFGMGMRGDKEGGGTDECVSCYRYV